MKPAIFLLSAISAVFMAVQALAFETDARSMIVVDYDSGVVLFAKNETTPLPPASMSKLMTINMAFEALKAGRLELSTEFRVSEKAWKMGGSKMFVEVGKAVSVENLLRGIIIASGNDACIVIAEGLSGSEAVFSDAMTSRARELGMMDSTFRNSTGWPDPDHVMSARDLVTIATRLIREFPEYYHYFAEDSFKWAAIDQPNRNPLLRLGIGADGLKTGHTEAAGYSLVGSAQRDGRRVVFAFTGLSSKAARAQEAERVVSWAFREFEAVKLFRAGTELAQADIWLGEQNTVPLVPLKDVDIVRPYGGAPMQVSVVYQSPVTAPVEQGQEIAQLVIDVPDMPQIRVPLAAAHSVARGGFFTRVKASASILVGKVFESTGFGQN